MAEHSGIEQAYGQESGPEARSHASSGAASGNDVKSRLNNYVRSRVSDQVVLSGVKLRKAADVLKKTAKCLNDGEQRLFGEYVGKSADRLEDFAHYLQDTPINRIVDHTRDFSEKQPWLFMGAGFATGIVLGRIIKASRRES